MVRVIPRQDHDGVLSYSEGIEAAREAFLEHAEHPSYNEMRHRVHTQSGVRVTVHQGVCPRVGGAGLMTHTEKPHSDEHHQKYAEKAPPVYVLHDSETGELQALLLGDLAPEELGSSGSVAPFRTAATSVAGLDALARDDATQVGVFGSGQQARNHLVALAQVRSLEHVNVYSPTTEHREAFADEMPAHVGAEIEAVDGPEQVISGADIVLTTTDASSPVFDGDLLEPGQTVLSIVGSNIELVESGNAPSPRREIDNRTVERSDLVVVNSVAQAKEYRQADFVIPVDEGLLDWDELVRTRDVIAGNHPGRTDDDQIILYKNNAGQGIIDVTLATYTWKALRDTDAGINIESSNPRPQ